MTEETELVDDHFHGKSMSRVGFTAKEKAQIRHMFTEISREWPNIEAFGSVVSGILVIYKVLRYGGLPAAALAVLGAWMKAQGWF